MPPVMVNSILLVRFHSPAVVWSFCHHLTDKAHCFSPKFIGQQTYTYKIKPRKVKSLIKAFSSATSPGPPSHFPWEELEEAWYTRTNNSENILQLFHLQLVVSSSSSLSITSLMKTSYGSDFLSSGLLYIYIYHEPPKPWKNKGLGHLKTRLFTIKKNLTHSNQAWTWHPLLTTGIPEF